MKRRILLTYPQELVPEPVIYRMVKQFEVIPNIRRADVSGDQGWVILELEGSETDVEAALEWIASTGVRVDHAMGEVLEG